MQTLSALDLKIRSFLRQVGYPVPSAQMSSIQLVRYFEQEFGCNVLGMLEQEYWEEQIEHDLEYGLFCRIHRRTDDNRAELDRPTVRLRH